MSDAQGIFLSYSRRDIDAADRVAELLREGGFAVLRDLDDILPTEAWRDRLSELIEMADAIVFLLSPASAVSEVCAWEVEYAASLHKKIAPIVVEDIAGAAIPLPLSRLNYIFATDAGQIENAVLTLCKALSGAAEWMREHTRLTSRALRFAKTGERAELLTSGELQLVLQWLARRPNDVPNASLLIQRFIETSQERDEEIRRFNEGKIRAIAHVIGPVVAARISELESQAEREDKSRTFVKISTRTEELRSEAAILRNVMEPFGRWHPQPAIRIKGLSAQEDYGELYQFPCCGLYLVLADEGAPLQFRADGCSTDPNGTQKDEGPFVIEHAKLISQPIVYERDLEPHLEEWTQRHFRQFNRNQKVLISLKINAQGNVDDARLVRATATTELDHLIEKLVPSRYVYEAATDSYGKPVADTVIEEIRLPHRHRDSEGRLVQG
ncbi:MAG TPA: toll/interleukin-1 receptor domain-containing protein [Allosphingosinicella sp.]|nr:toll/interleukin-1 receptor domain-containing protein [Allosphingosinicella sp.]